MVVVHSVPTRSVATRAVSNCAIPSRAVPGIGNEKSDPLIALLCGAIAGLVRRDRPDLSARQLGIFLICYLDDTAQTVRGLATALRVSRPAVTRGLDRLTQFDLVRRKLDPTDRRSILVQRTATGNGFLRDLRSILNAASASGAAQPGSPSKSALKPAPKPLSPAAPAKSRPAAGSFKPAIRRARSGVLAAE